MTQHTENLNTDEFFKALGNRIKELRKERGWSLRDMIIQHGYHEAQWRRFERGGAVNIHSLLRIAKAFQTSLSCLLDGLGEFSEMPSGGASSLHKKPVPKKSLLEESSPTQTPPGEETKPLRPPSKGKAGPRRRATDSSPSTRS